MQTRKFTKQFDYTTGHGRSVTSYQPDGGPDRDGVFEVSDAVAEAADKAGATEAPPKAKDTGGTGGGAGGDGKTGTVTK